MILAVLIPKLILIHLKIDKILLRMVMMKILTYHKHRINKNKIHKKIMMKIK